MTVKELIDILKKCESDREVFVNGEEDSEIQVSEETIYDGPNDVVKRVILWV